MVTKTDDAQLASKGEVFLSPQVNWLSRLMDAVVPVTWERVIISVLTLSAVISRLWALGSRVMSHDESQHVYFSWLLASGKGFTHTPITHGPFLFEATALINLLFGASDSTSRLVAVIAGIFIAVVVPQLLKSWLGRVGALITSTLLLISPYVLYYSRYLRHDIIVLAWTLLAIIAIFRYLENRQGRDLLLLAISLAFMFSTMEITFFYLVIFTGYLLVRLIAKQGVHWQAIRHAGEFDLLVVITTLGAFFSSPIALLGLNPIWNRLTSAPYVEISELSSQTYAWATGITSIRLYILLFLFAGSAIALGVWWGKTLWLKLAAVFGGITILTFTTFFSNPGGFGTGFIGSLGYWMSQQAVARGSQPLYYYLIVLPIYEYLPLLGGFAAALYYSINYKSLSITSQKFVGFLLWWGFAIIIGLSLAGEKMPWLSTHITIPFILLTGWWLGQLVQKSWLWGGLRKERFAIISRGLVLSLFTLLALSTVRTSIYVNYINYDYTTEYIDYAHGAPGVKWVMDDIQQIANHTSLGRNIKVAFDADASWPLTWYLRDYPNQSFYASQPNRQALDAEVVIAGPNDWQKVEEILRNKYHRFEVIRLWWPLEDYKNLTWSRIRFALIDPAMRGAVWDILWKRDYRKYAELTAQNIDPPVRWPLSELMRIYVRKDIASQMLSMSLGNTMLTDLPEPADTYAGIEKTLQPNNVLTPGLNTPRNLAVAPDGTLFILDSGNARVIHADKSGSILHSWGSLTPTNQQNPTQGTFNDPWGIAVDTQGQVYVADTWNHRIQKFKSDGTFLLQWGTSGTADQGTDKFWGPRGVAIGQTGQVYVTDTGNKRVLVFNLEGKYLSTFDTSGEGQLEEPVGIAVGPDGQVYVADTWNSRVAVFSADGKYLNSWPVEGWIGESLDNKPYLAVDGQGRFYVTDPEGYRVIVFSNSGKPMAVFGQYGSEEDSFALPLGVAVGQQDTLWIVDSGNNRLVKYPKLEP